MTRQHISEVELCVHKDWMELSNCPSLHKEDFCLLCGYEIQGDRLYLEIHGPKGGSDNTRDIDSSQPYACMECASKIRSYNPISGKVQWLLDFAKQKKQ